MSAAAVPSSTVTSSVALEPAVWLPSVRVDALPVAKEAVLPQKLPASVIDALIGSLATVEGDARLHVEDCLVRYGSRTLPAVLEGLNNPSTLVQSRCAFVVVRLGQMAVPAYRQWRDQQTDATLNQPLMALIEEQLGLV